RGRQSPRPGGQLNGLRDPGWADSSSRTRTCQVTNDQLGNYEHLFSEVSLNGLRADRARRASSRLTRWRSSGKCSAILKAMSDNVGSREGQSDAATAHARFLLQRRSNENSEAKES